jgi:ABC-type branched-subunit amino acid transport system permease subunit
VAPYIHAWLGAFAFTQAVEVPIWAYALAEHRKLSRGAHPWPFWVCAAVGFGASAITHPIVWFVIPRYAPGGYVAMVLQAEAFAVVVEAVYTSLAGLRWSLGWSICANAASAGLGLLSREVFGWP